MLGYFRLANPLFEELFFKNHNVLHRELKKMPLLPAPAFKLIIAGSGLQVTKVLATFGTVDTQETSLQMRKFFLPPDESFEEPQAPHPWEWMECNFTIQNDFRFSKCYGYPTIKIALPPHPPLTLLLIRKWYNHFLPVIWKQEVR